MNIRIASLAVLAIAAAVLAGCSPCHWRGSKDPRTPVLFPPSGIAGTGQA